MEDTRSVGEERSDVTGNRALYFNSSKLALNLMYLTHQRCSDASSTSQRLSRSNPLRHALSLQGVGIMWTPRFKYQFAHCQRSSIRNGTFPYTPPSKHIHMHEHHSLLYDH